MKFFQHGYMLSALALAGAAIGCGGGDTSGTGGTGGTTTTSPVCGNGTVEDGEQCDDGDKNADTAACKADCTPAACGDSLVQAGVEECDDGAMNADTAACTSMCKKAICGDAVVQQGVETCDNGANNGDTKACTSMCKEAACGDSLVQEGVEECDDGAGNADNAGCTLACKTNVCGDGKVKTGKEECDDGAANGDTAACTAMCKAAKCGDGLVQVGVEGCDDANMVDGDSCTNKCTLPACGDGIVQMGEQCDLGAMNSNTGTCTVLCKTAICGDGFTQAGVEECDNAAMNNNAAACTATCKNAKCGDGLVQAGVEECDLAAQNSNTGGCTLMCKNAKCGDGFIQAGIEACDDANMTNADGCNNNCIVSGTPLMTLSYNGVASGADSWAGIATDAAGNIYVTGTEQTAVQGQNLLIRKYSAQGAVIWTQTYNNPAVNGNEEGLGITLDPSGNVFVIGYETIAGGTTNIYLAKYNGTNGTAIWQKSYDGGANNNDYGWGVVANATGDVFIATQVTQVVAQGTDILVAKVAGINGTQVWTDFVNGVVVNGGNNNDAGLGITIDSQGAVVASGGIRGLQDLDVWVRKYTDNGVSNTIQWTRTYNNGVGVADDVGYAVTADPMNNVIVGGVETVSGQGGNVWVRKYDSSGNTVWTRTYASATALNDIIYGIDTDAAGNVVVGGFEAIANTTADVFVRKYSPAGTELWTQKYNGNADQDDIVNNVFIDGTGNIFVAGFQTVTNQGTDAWIRKYAP